MLNTPEAPPARGPVLRAVRFLALPLALALALLVAGIVGGLVLDNGAYIAVFVLGAIFAPLLLTFTLLAGSLRAGSLPSFAAERELRTQGERALARVDKLTPTGTSINDAHLTELSITVVPAHGRAFRTVTRHPIHPVHAPAFQRGKVIVVRCSDRYPGVVRVDKEPPEDWVGRAEAPLTVGTVYETYTGEAPGAERERRNPLVRVVVTLLSTAALTAVLLLPIREDVLGQVLASPELLRAGELERGVDKMVETGGGRVAELMLLSDRLRADTEAGPVSYRGGTARIEDRIGGADEPEDYFDVHEVNIAAIPGLVELARSRFGLADSTGINVRIARSTDGPIEITLGQRESGRSETLVAAADGTPALTADAFTADGARAALALLTERMGGSEVYELSISRDRVEAEAPTTPGAPTADEFSWYSGRLLEQRAAPIQPDEDDRRFDLSEFDPAVLPRLLARLDEQSDVATPVEECTFYLEYESDGRLALRTSIQDDYNRASLTAAVDGSDVVVETGR